MLLKTDLIKIIRTETLDTITRNNDDIITEAIHVAEQQAKAYLTKYNLSALFSSNDYFLKRIIANLSIWHILTICNANIELELRRANYEDAIKTLEKIQKGIIQPDGWILNTIINTDDNMLNAGTTFFASSNNKRNNHF